MRMKKLKLLRFYREILLECKKNKLIDKLNDEVQNKNFTKEKDKQKILTLFK